MTEGPWDDWFVSVAVADERGRQIATVADDGAACEVVLDRLLVEAEEAILADFLARRQRPSRLEDLRRGLICRLVWLRNVRPRVRARRRGGQRRSRRPVGRR